VRAAIGPRAALEFSIDTADFERGVLHLLVGGNGCGKSTFVRILLGFRSIQRGSLTWHFNRAGQLEINRATRANSLAPLYQNVGYVPQGGGDSLWPDRTVREHVLLPLRMKDWKGCTGQSAQEREDYVNRILERALVAPAFWDRRPGLRSSTGQASAMSGGERQRVAYARAISTDPEALVLDELEAALDETSRRQFIDSLIRDYLGTRTAGERTAFVVTHDPGAWTALARAPVETVFWQFSRSATGQLSLLRQKQRLPLRKAAPALIFAFQEQMTEELAHPLLTHEPWNEMGWKLCKALRAFLDATLSCAPVILSVAALTRPQSPEDAPHAILLAATGPVGATPDGRDAELLRQFTTATQPPTFPDPATFKPPPGERIPLRRSLLAQLIQSGLDEAYKGFRVDSLEDHGVREECFAFDRSLQQGLGDTQGYIELSKHTQTVYLFRAVTRQEPARHESSLAIAFDFLDDTCKLDEWHRLFVLHALGAALRKLEHSVVVPSALLNVRQ
jgi:phospholipid/cholesterol/gamma-HCH transport system ATP-binding protein